MKFLKWVEDVDHLAVPIAVDIGPAVFAAGLVTAVLRYIFEWRPEPSTVGRHGRAVCLRRIGAGTARLFIGIRSQRKK